MADYFTTCRRLAWSVRGTVQCLFQAAESRVTRLLTTAMNSRFMPPNLLKLGVGKRTAILTGISSKSYWHLSRSQATQVGMTNDWLKAQGLVSIRDLWMKAHGYA